MDIRKLKSKHGRTLFWLIYILDKEVSVQTGQPPSINDEHVNLCLPHGHRNYLGDQNLAVESLNVDSVGSFPLYDTRLALIKSRVFDELYSFRARQKPSLHLLQDITVLDSLLDCWRATLPPKLRPSLWVLSEDNANLDMSVIMVTLTYYDCLSAIHGASTRCRAPTPDPSIEIEMVDSDLTYAVKASRFSLEFLFTTRKCLDSRYAW